MAGKNDPYGAGYGSGYGGQATQGYGQPQYGQQAGNYGGARFPNMGVGNSQRFGTQFRPGQPAMSQPFPSGPTPQTPQNTAGLTQNQIGMGSYLDPNGMLTFTGSQGGPISPVTAGFLGYGQPSQVNAMSKSGFGPGDPSANTSFNPLARGGPGIGPLNGQPQGGGFGPTPPAAWDSLGGAGSEVWGGGNGIARGEPSPYGNGGMGPGGVQRGPIGPVYPRTETIDPRTGLPYPKQPQQQIGPNPLVRPRQTFTNLLGR